MKSIITFLLGALIATVFWFAMGFIQVDGQKMEQLIHPNGVTTEELFPDTEPAAEEAVAQPEAAAPAAPASIVGRWRIADPVGTKEEERMLQFDEYGIFKDYHYASAGISTEWNYIIDGDVLKYGHGSNCNTPIQFKTSSVNGKDYLEIYNNTEFGGKWIRSK